MLDGDSFIKAGWILNLQLHQFVSSDKLKFVVMERYRAIIMDVINYRYVDLYRLSIPMQRIAAVPLLQWVIVEKTGEIGGANCTCMAG